MLSEWPKPDNSFIKKKIERDMRTVKDIVVSVRNIRSDLNIPYSKRLTAYLSPSKEGAEARLEGGGAGYVEHIARLERLAIQKTRKKPDHCASAILESFNVFIPLKGVIDIEAEKARLVKKMEGLDKQLKFSMRKLKDKNFVAKAPEKIVELEKERGKELKDQMKRLKDTLRDL